MNNSKSSLGQDIFTVVDTTKILQEGVLGVGLVGVTIFFGLLGTPIGWGLLILGGILLGSLPAEKKGVILNINDNTMEFPGGGLSANEFSDYLKLEFIMKKFKRFTVSINSITQISTDRKVTVDKKGNIHKKFYLIVVGTFGSLRLTFTNELKRDELYSLIRDINQMGTPVFEA